jgi:NAD(P)-dependent dehydrogenase (short-subunit alcohol dehydrogenase family)
MDLHLTGKKALVTGSTAGIGFGIAMGLAAEGCEVIVNGRTQDRVDKAISSIQKQHPGVKIRGAVADFSDQHAVENLIKSIGDVDILINNVGIFTSQSFEETTNEDWRRLFDVNVMSGVSLSRALLPGMLQRNWGRILFISSECAYLVPENLIAYSTTKAALLALSRGLAQCTKGTGVTVNTLIPGSTLSEGAESFLHQMAQDGNTTKEAVADAFFRDERTSSLIQRFATIQEVANTAVYFCSPLASVTNGASIKVDGGSIPGI